MEGASGELVGRAVELAQIDALLQGARAGNGGVLSFTGEPGAGKTTLLAAARAQAADFTILDCCGVEWEAELPFSALHELLRPTEGLMDALPAPQRRALDAAFGRCEDAVGTGFHAYAGTLSLILEATRERPVLLIVDDIQWLDALSAQAIAFVARRIAGDAVAVLGAARPGGRLPGLAEPIDVTPLDRGAVAELAARELGHALPDAAIDELAAASAGNPLAVVESAAHAGDELWLRGTGLEGPLPVGTLIERGFSERLDGLSTSALRAAQLVAACVDADVEVVREALHTMELPVEALDELVSRRVLAHDGDRWRFAHPLLRSIVHGRAFPAERREVHRALATASIEPGLVAWHRAQAAAERDERIADELGAVAEQYARVGGALAAAAAFERAAELTPDPDTRAERLIAAARGIWHGGGPAERVTELSAIAQAVATTPRVRAYAEAVAVLHRSTVGAARQHHPELIDLADRARGIDDDLAASLLRTVLTDVVLDGDHAATLDAIDQLRAVRDRLDLSTTMRISIDASMAAYGMLHGCAVDPTSTLLSLAHECGVRLRHERPVLRVFGGGSPMVIGEALVWCEEYEAAHQLLQLFNELLGAQGDTFLELGSQFALIELYSRTGRWADVERQVERARVLVDLCGVISTGAMIEATFQRIRAYATAGISDDTLLRAMGDGMRSDTPLVTEYVAVARGAAALSAGRPAEALAHFEEAYQWTRRAGQVEPCAGTWPVDHLLSALLAGEAARAGELLAQLREYAERTERRWAMAGATWLGAVATDDDDAAFAGFDAALAIYAETTVPFDEARAQLAYGQRLRRANRRADARVQLEAALATFDRIGAEPWADRARRELGASGKGTRRAKPHERDALTPQERQVAALIASGASNKEAAGELFLSPKTIESHLSRIYRKLGVTSRSQLAARWEELGG